MNSIRMNLVKSVGESDPSASHFFGNPALPSEWINEGVIGEYEIFICQIRLRDIAEFDTENRLPHTGYLYFFMEFDENKTCYPIVKYYDGEPDSVVEEFNKGLCDEFNLYYELETEYSIEFSSQEEEAIEDSDCSNVDGHKLLGYPSDLQEGVMEDGDVLLLQYDPLETEGLDFFQEIDGYIYFFVPEDDLEEKNFDNVGLLIERS